MAFVCLACFTTKGTKKGKEEPTNIGATIATLPKTGTPTSGWGTKAGAKEGNKSRTKAGTSGDGGADKAPSEGSKFTGVCKDNIAGVVIVY